jgi:hypothetical protein
MQNHPIELVFNLDKVDISEWEDRKTKNVIVFVLVIGQIIHHKITRNLKHLFVIVCVSATGENLIPYTVTSQDSPTIRVQLKKCNIRFDTDFILKDRSKSYINAEMVGDYICTIFFSNLI